MAYHAARSIYVIAAKMGPVKIGSSLNMQERWRQLQVANFDELTLVFVGECDGPGIAGMIERETHAQLAAFRVRGEWYQVSARHAVQAIMRIALQLGHVVTNASIAAPTWKRPPGMQKGKKQAITRT